MSKQIRFGVYTVDVRAGEITKYGTRIRLQDRPFQILLLLLSHAGEVVTREELRQELWPDGTFVDFDRGISSAVNKLRSAIGDTAANPKFIETVGRRGYRFIYPLTGVETPLESTAPSEVQNLTTPPRSGWRRNGALASVVLLIGGLLTSAAYLVRRGNAARPIRSIAVLPLDNLSNSADQEFFSEGLTDELTERLASLGGLRVISRTSAMQYKGSHKPLPEIARELQVDGVVEGTVLRVGDRVRITVDLIEASTDRHIWAASYEREQRDILALQNDVTRQIAESIQLRLNPVVRERLTTTRPIDPQAMEDYLRGRMYWNQRTSAGFANAIQFFDRAIARDPKYAPAYAGLADSYALLAAYELESSQLNISKARQAALKALQLDDGLAEAHTSLALIYQNYDGNWAAAEKEYRRAIALDDNYATAHHWYAEFLCFMGRFSESSSQYAIARKLDPLSLIIRTDYATSLYYQRKYDEAVAEFRAVQRIDPDFVRGHLVYSVYIQQGRYEEAFAEIHRVPDSLWVQAWLVNYYEKIGKRKDAELIFQRLQESYRKQTYNPTPMIIACIGIGQRDQAMQWLQKLYEGHYPATAALKVDPIYDSLRKDPRFIALLARAGLDQR